MDARKCTAGVVSAESGNLHEAQGAKRSGVECRGAGGVAGGGEEGVQGCEHSCLLAYVSSLWWCLELGVIEC